MAQPDIRYALGSMFVAIAEATSLATDKPVGALSGLIMRRMAEGMPTETAELCRYLADCADGEQEMVQ
jgi:hypothetical protein